MQLLAWSSAFSSGEFSGTRKQLSAGLVPVTACKGRRWLFRKRAGTGFLLPEEGKNLNQWDVIYALAGNTAPLESAVPASLSLAEIKDSICLHCGQRAGGLCHQSAHTPVHTWQQGGCICAAEFKCCVLEEESKHLLVGKDTQSDRWNILFLHQEMMAAFTSSVVLCPVSLADVTLSAKNVHWPFLLFPPCGFNFYQVEI